MAILQKFSIDLHGTKDALRSKLYGRSVSSNGKLRASGIVEGGDIELWDAKSDFEL